MKSIDEVFPDFSVGESFELHSVVIPPEMGVIEVVLVHKRGNKVHCKTEYLDPNQKEDIREEYIKRIGESGIDFDYFSNKLYRQSSKTGKCEKRVESFDDLKLNESTEMTEGWGEGGTNEEEEQEITETRSFLKIRGKPTSFTESHCNTIRFSISLIANLVQVIAFYNRVPLPYPMFQINSGIIIFSSENQ